MSSREKILNDVKTNQGENIPLPSITWPNNDLNVEHFMSTLRGIGGEVMIAANEGSVNDGIVAKFGGDKKIVRKVEGGESTEAMEKIDVAVIEGQIGVAENGAIWIDGDSMGHRVLPFICQHLVIVLPESQIVSTMHHAYSRIDVAEPGFGVFIAGPSKTADIEQSLVIGAHGARSLTVYILRD